jgi:hypothetical protein
MSLESEMFDYHRDNPHIYRYVDQFAQEAIRAGYKKFAIATIWEKIRWEIRIKTLDANFKLPNNHRAYYARLWMRNNPAYPDFFETCELRSERYVTRDRWGRIDPDRPDPDLFD